MSESVSTLTPSQVLVPQHQPSVLGPWCYGSLDQLRWMIDIWRQSRTSPQQSVSGPILGYFFLIMLRSFVFSTALCFILALGCFVCLCLPCRWRWLLCDRTMWENEDAAGHRPATLLYRSWRKNNSKIEILWSHIVVGIKCKFTNGTPYFGVWYWQLSTQGPEFCQWKPRKIMKLRNETKQSET